MNLTEFWKMRRIYEERARARAPEYLDSPSADMSWGERVNTEMVIDVLLRMEKLEKLLEPAPEESQDKELKLEKPRKGPFF
jgi:hypothetical protein